MVDTYYECFYDSFMMLHQYYALDAASRIIGAYINRRQHILVFSSSFYEEVKRKNTVAIIAALWRTFCFGKQSNLTKPLEG